MNNNSNSGWPYHEYEGKVASKIGTMVPCKSNPCTLHGGNDVYASSPEEAYEKKYTSSSNSNGLSKKSIFSSNPSLPLKKFRAAKRIAMTVLIASLASSGLSACSSADNYSNDAPSSNVKTEQSQTSYNNKNTGERTRFMRKAEEYANKAENVAKNLSNKAVTAYNSSTGREYRRKAKSMFGMALGAVSAYAGKHLKKYSNYASESNNYNAPTSNPDKNVPDMLNAHNSITMNDVKSLKVVSDHGNNPGYNRKNYSHGQWKNMNGSSCWSVRDEVIKRQADPGSLKLTPNGCAVASVSMTDPYTGQKIVARTPKEVATNIQIDHVIPIAYMDSNGGKNWNQHVKDSYYNDLEPGHLIATSAHQNRDLKSDKGPGEYMLDNSAPLSYKVAYAKDWVAIIKKYNKLGGNMTIEKSDYDAIVNIFRKAGVK